MLVGPLYSVAFRAATCGADWKTIVHRLSVAFAIPTSSERMEQGGGKFRSADALADAISAAWPKGQAAGRFVVCTGGEPLLQLDEALVQALHDRGFAVAIETNGTLAPPPGIDWICVSPKAGAELVVKKGNELKLVFPQEGAAPEAFEELQFDYRFLQPMDNASSVANTEATVAYCLSHPKWRLSLQTHKIIGIR